MSVLGRLALTIGAVALITSCGGTQNGPTAEPPPGSGLGKTIFHATSGEVRCSNNSCVFHASGQANGDDGVFHHSFDAKGGWQWDPAKDTWTLLEKIYVNGFDAGGGARTIEGVVIASGKGWASHVKPDKFTADHLILNFHSPAERYVGDNGSIVVDYSGKQFKSYDSEFDMHD